MTVIPDSITPKSAWRAWRIGTNATDARAMLLSLNGGGGAQVVWPSGEPLKARCPMLSAAFDADGYGVNVVRDPNEMQRIKAHLMSGSTPSVYEVDEGQHRVYFTRKSYLLLPRAVEAKFVVPVMSCSCGIYAVEGLEEAKRYADPNCVLGRVALWGQVVVGDQGYRAQFAYPQSIFVPDEHFRDFKPRLEHYGVPVFKASDLVQKPLAELEKAEREVLKFQKKADIERHRRKWPWEG